MASLLQIIHTTRYDYTTKPQAVIPNYFGKHVLELFLAFCKTNLVIYEPIIKRMLAAYWGLQNRVFFFFWILIASINLCWHGIQTFCGSNHLWAYKEVDAYCVMTSSKSGRLSLFEYPLSLFKLLLIWISKFLWKEPSVSP